MFLVDNEIKSIGNKVFGDTFTKYKVGCVSYEMEIEGIVTSKTKYEKDYVIEPFYSLEVGKSVFVRIKGASISIPNNIVGVVRQKNSVMRDMLVVDAPTYQCGYKGAVYLRVFNIGDEPYLLTEGINIAHMMLYKTTSIPTEPYGYNKNAKYQNEDEFRRK